MTLFRLLASNCGMSLKETAAYLEMPLATTTAHWKGLRGAAPASITRLHKLDRLIQSIATELLRGLGEMLSEAASNPRTIRLKRMTTDEAASRYKLPYASCHEAVIGRVLTRIPRLLVARVVFVEEGDDVEID